MQTRRLGSLKVSIVGLGCNNFGGRLDATATAKVVSAAIEAGITLFDTADIYGGTQSEVLLGQALGDKRDKIVLATKFGAEVNGERAGGSAAYIARAVESSLRRLGTDRIDLYQIHTPDVTVQIAETLGALDALVKAGKVIEIGCANFSVAQLREAAVASAPGTARFVSVQNELSLLHRDDEAEVLPECAHTDLAYLPYFPLASGMLTGKYTGTEQAKTGRLAEKGGLSDKFRTPTNVAHVEALTKFAANRGHSLLELAFGWLLAHPPVSSVIAGASSPEQVRSNVAAASWELGDEMLELAKI